MLRVTPGDRIPDWKGGFVKWTDFVRESEAVRPGTDEAVEEAAENQPQITTKVKNRSHRMMTAGMAAMAHLTMKRHMAPMVMLTSEMTTVCVGRRR